MCNYNFAFKKLDKTLPNYLEMILNLLFSIRFTAI
jgi:hypothetical protein